MNDITEDDFFDEALADASAPDTTARVLQAFKEMMAAEEAIETLTALMEEHTKVVAKHKSSTLPELLKEMGTEIWRDPETGITVELETSVNASLPKDVDKRNIMLDALRPIGIEQILAEEFTVVFAPNDLRSLMIREILGLEQPTMIDDDHEKAPDEASKPVMRLTNEQTALIHDLRYALQLGTLPAEEKLGVHASRLKSWLKTMIDKGYGKTITDAGIWHGKYAKVVKPKETKPKKEKAK